MSTRSIVAFDMPGGRIKGVGPSAFSDIAATIPAAVDGEV